MALTTAQIAKRAYEQLRACEPTVYVSDWEDLPHAVRFAFAYMVMEGSEAGCKAMLAELVAEEEAEAASCTRH